MIATIPPHAAPLWQGEEETLGADGDILRRTPAGRDPA